MPTHLAATYPASLSDGLLVARVFLGLLMAAHGAQKLFGWFGGHGLVATSGFFEGLGLHPGRWFATAAGVTEFAGGLLTALGFLGPVGQALMLSVMIVAAVTVHAKNGVFASTNGIEMPALYAVGAITLALTGPGRFSLDALLGLETLWTPALVLEVLGLGVVGAIGNLILWQPAPSAPTAEP